MMIQVAMSELTVDKRRSFDFDGGLETCQTSSDWSLDVYRTCW
jgi:hypothetical protein